MKHSWHRFLVFSLTVIAWGLLIALKSTPSALASPNKIVTNEVFRQGVEATQNGKYSDALKAFTQTIEANPDFAAAYANRCLVETMF